MTNRVFAAFAGACVMCALCGCIGGGDDGFKPDPNAGKTAQQRADEQIKAIQDNPNIPADQKERAIATVQAMSHGAHK